MEFLSIFEFIGIAIFSAACCWGFNVACRFDGYEEFDALSREEQQDYPKPKPEDRMVLWWVRYYFAPILGPFWSKPVFKCMICMSSIQTIYPLWLYLDYTIFYLPHDFWVIYPAVLLATAGINAFLAYNFNTR